MANITLAILDANCQDELRNTVNSPFSQTQRVRVYNKVIDFLQSKANWNRNKQVANFEFLNTEVDYSLETNLGITDFKQFKELRFVEDSNTHQSKEFEEVDGNDFTIYERQKNFNNYLNFEDRNGTLIMRVLANIGKGRTLIDSMDDLTTGRTWASDTSGSDATTLAQDTTRAKSGNSLRFNLDVSQSANNKGTIETTTVFTNAIDASLLENVGVFRFWLDLNNFTSANLARISSVEFRWGNSSSVYWSEIVTAPATGGSFVKGLNRMSFNWSDAEETGTVDNSELDYFLITINYTSALTDSNNIRVDEIVLYEPIDTELVYYSNNMVNKSGTGQAHFTTSIVDTTEELLLPEGALSMFVKHAVKELFPQKEKGNSDYNRVSLEAEQQLDLCINQYGNAITRESAEFEIDGNSNSRESSNQW